MSTHLLPEQPELTPGEAAIVAEFVGCLNGGDLDALADLFVEDAHVNDQLRNFWGRDAITGWLERELIGEHVKLGVRRVRKHYGTVIVDAGMTGDFAVTGIPQPLGVDLHLTIQGDRIVRLLVLLARHDTPEPEVRRLL